MGLPFQLRGCLICSVVLLSSLFCSAQKECDTTEISDLERTFMPTVQMGYVHHVTSELSGGLMTQTSLEYRDFTNFIFRLNYDVFNSRMQVAYPLDSNTTYTGRTTFTDLIAGVGYRIDMNKHFMVRLISPLQLWWLSQDIYSGLQQSNSALTRPSRKAIF